MDRIPQSCIVNKYYFHDAEKYNFPSQYGVGRNYYRVDRDAINFDCNSDDRCIASNVVQDVFIDTGTGS
jgi:hypothetical protein